LITRTYPGGVCETTTTLAQLGMKSRGEVPKRVWARSYSELSLSCAGTLLISRRDREFSIPSPAYVTSTPASLKQGRGSQTNKRWQKLYAAGTPI
jgi:hypothetical protein